MYAQQLPYPSLTSQVRSYFPGVLLGWSNGRNVRIESRWAAGSPERQYAAELVALAPDIIATPGLALAISSSWVPISLSRALARILSESMRMPVLSLGAASSSIACMIEGTPAITITLPIQKPGAPDTWLRTRSAPLGMRVIRLRASLISAPVALSHACRMASARGSGIALLTGRRR